MPGDIHTAHEHHLVHPINRMLRDYNEFVDLVFVQMTKATYTKTTEDINRGHKLAKALGLSKTDCNLTGPSLSKQAVANRVKEKIVSFLCKVIRKENRFDQLNLGEEIHGRQLNNETVNYMKNAILKKKYSEKPPFIYYIG